MTDFDKQVSQALRASGWTVEHTGTDGELLATERRLDDDRRMAVICRDGSEPVTAAGLWSTLATPLDLLERREIDSVYVITAVDAADDLKEYAVGIRHLKVLRLDELLAAALDFGEYLQDLLDTFATSPDGLPDYYIQPRTRVDEDLETVVRRWIRGTREPDEPDGPEPDQPIAVLGAYGMGKSSFSSHLAAVLAEAAKDDPHARIPILIRLGDLAGEQTLEGLLGKQFTATYHVPGYSFAAFQSLNQAGRFVVILDGFDEMKQLLSWNDFEYNLGQLYRLHDGDSRLIVLGRPTAFETDEEQEMALHAGGGRADAGWPNCFEVELSPFNNDEIRLFLGRYVRYRRPDLADPDAEVAALWDKVGSRHLRDVARRPVQLRMLAEILPEYAGEISELDLARIYDIFIGHLIDTIIQREDDKNSRAAFDSTERRAFLTSLAFWLWKEQKATFVASETVPLELVEPYAKGRDLLAVRRDLFAGSPLDRRIGERFGFPHRSFQEFLVAETIWSRLRTGTLTLAEADPLVSQEVSSFMSLQRGRQETAAATRLVKALKPGTTLCWRLVTAVFMAEEVMLTIRERLDAHLSVRTGRANRRNQGKITSWELLLLTTWTRKHPQSDAGVTIQEVLKLAQAEDFTLTALFCVLRLGGTPRRVEEAFQKLVAMLVDGGTPQAVRSALVTGGQARPSGDYVYLSRLNGPWSFGRRTGEARVETGRNGRPSLVGGNELRVRWLAIAGIHLALRLDIGRGRTANARAILRSLRPVFGMWLPTAGFISDWLAPSGDLAADVQLNEDFEITPAVRDQILDVLEPVRTACAALGLDVAFMERGTDSPELLE
ncbi:NACHT domain-containing protein [Micromonospora sp. CA-248260]|uniref:NACHT domain-containing protein n=1 Tax=Micromonospora sp. CA-248260 TaxID=3239962 RepID=UPI003D93A71E